MAVMSRTATVPFAVRSVTLVCVPCTMSILAAKLAKAVCCHHLVFLSSQRMKLPWRASRTDLITRLPRLAVHGAMQALQPVRRWEVGQGRKHNAFREPFPPRFLVFMFEVSLFSSHVPLALSVPRFVFGHLLVLLLCPGIAEFLLVHLSNRPRAS